MPRRTRQARPRCIAPRPPVATESHGYVLDLDLRQIVDAEAERRGKLHVPRLADDDVDVRIGVARAAVVDLQVLRVAIPDGDGTVRQALLLDDVEQQAIDGHRVGREHDLARIEDIARGAREGTAVPD